MWYYEVHEKKIWPGINVELPVYAFLNFVCRDPKDAQDIADYLQVSNPKGEYAVVARHYN